MRAITHRGFLKGIRIMETIAMDETLDASTSRYQEAYERVVPEMEALSDDELVHINLDVPAAVTTGIGAWPEIQQQRDRILGELPRFDLEKFDKLDVYARAALVGCGRAGEAWLARWGASQGSERADRLSQYGMGRDGADGDVS